MLIKDRVKWWEPYRATRREALKGLKSSGLFKPGPWIRPTIIVGVLMIPLLAWILHSFPGISLPWMRMILYLLLAGPLVLLFGVAMAVLPPRHIEVRRQGLQVSHGQSNYRIEHDRIESIELDGNDGNGPRLVVTYHSQRRNRRKTRAFAVSPKVDIESLSALVEHLASEPATR